jgi:RNA polymerase II subunit A small phosphatase-like protein
MTSFPHRHLVILDLDETLVYATNELNAIERPCDFSVFDYAVWKRPYLSLFLMRLFEWFDVAVWTASDTRYAQAIVPHVFPEPEQLQFVWARTRCTQRFNREQNAFYWIKNLNKVKRVLRRPLSQMVMIDDSAEKLERHYGNLLTVTPFFGDAHDTELRDLVPYLAQLRSAENIRSIEKRNWRIALSPQASV